MALPSKNVIGLALVAVAGTMGYMKTVEDRAAMVEMYQLVNGEPEAYDTCLDALTKKELKNGGNKQEFCGCFAKAATGRLNQSHKTVAGDFLDVVAEDNLTEDSITKIIKSEALADPSDSPELVALDIMSAFGTCNDEVSNTCKTGDSECLERIQARSTRRTAAKEAAAAKKTAENAELSGEAAATETVVQQPAEQTAAAAPAPATDFHSVLPQ
jgi:hypothetical protein